MSSLTSLTVQAVGEKLSQYFGCVCLELPTNDRIHTFARLASSKGKEPSFPMICYSLTSLALNQELGNPSVAARVPLGIRQTVETVHGITAIQAKFDLEVTFLDNNRERLLALMTKWLMASVTGKLNFSIQLGGNNSVAVQVKPDSTITSPQHDMSVDVVNLYEMQGTLAVNSFISEEFSTASTYTRLRAINETTYLADSPTGDVSQGDDPRSQAFSGYTTAGLTPSASEQVTRSQSGETNVSSN